MNRKALQTLQHQERLITMSFQIDSEKPCHVHFIGIGGMSMSGLAFILREKGFHVTGSDRAESIETNYLKNLGFQVWIGHDASHITEDTGLLVYNAAIHPDNPEFAKAAEMNIPMLTRGELLGQIMREYPVSVGVAGTHGKTTTTSIMSHILLAAGLDPTITVGSELPKIGGTVRCGKSPVFLAEACEYTNSFHYLYPLYEIVLNIEAEHMDFFKDMDDVRNSFRKYMENVPAEGAVVIDYAIKDLDELTAGLPCRVVTYNMTDKNADYHAENISLIPGTPYYEFDVCKKGCAMRLMHVQLSVPGIHNVGNCLSAIVTALLMGIRPEAIVPAIAEYTGAGARFEKKGPFNGGMLYDDYAHHPQEIEATLKAAVNFPHRQIWALFQPHTYSRTKQFFNEFVQALSLADHVVLMKLYPARETDTLGVSSELLCEALRKNGVDAHYCPTFDDMKNFLRKQDINGDLLITMSGSGNIHEFGDYLLSEE